MENTKIKILKARVANSSEADLKYLPNIEVYINQQNWNQDEHFLEVKKANFIKDL